MRSSHTTPAGSAGSGPSSLWKGITKSARPPALARLLGSGPGRGFGAGGGGRNGGGGAGLGSARDLRAKQICRGTRRLRSIPNARPRVRATPTAEGKWPGRVGVGVLVPAVHDAQRAVERDGVGQRPRHSRAREVDLLQRRRLRVQGKEGKGAAAEGRTLCRNAWRRGSHHKPQRAAQRLAWRARRGGRTARTQPGISPDARVSLMSSTWR